MKNNKTRAGRKPPHSGSETSRFRPGDLVRPRIDQSGYGDPWRAGQVGLILEIDATWDGQQQGLQGWHNVMWAGDNKPRLAPEWDLDFVYQDEDGDGDVQQEPNPVYNEEEGG
jgi:hypothetical protein